MPYLHQYRLFISHKWKYSEGYDRIIQFLTAAPNFEYRNYSVPEHKAFVGLSTPRLAEQLKNQIRPVQCVIILGGMYVSYSDWIQYEINYAKELGKPILGIYPWGAQKMPLAVTVAADEIVGWNTNSILTAIRRLVP
ncbi:TIR domain-containing protein [Methylobacterium sp. 88A]|uniref:TIR domain-containing protein n=1 Tax=Methylobacterium sp. 88A TaxID=1131813 RepID=UPI0009DAC939|nr:TIR domain-containing protein [Methylobacterium sp. 88A]